MKSAHIGVLRLLRERSIWLLGTFWIAVALCCTQLPLVQTLGYEFSMVMGLAVAWTGAPVFLTLSRRLNRVQGSSLLSDAVRIWGLIAGVGLLLLLPPASVMAFNALFVRNCAPLEGLLLYLLIPAGTVLFAAAIAVFFSVLFPKRAWPALLTLLLALLAQPFLEILARPQLYSYNHVFGMFVGLSWDQQQPPLETLALYRILTLAYIGLLLSTAVALKALRKDGRISVRIRKQLVSVFIPALAAALLLTFYSDELGFSNSMRHLRSRLSGTLHTPNFTIIYDTSAVTEDELRIIADEHEFRLHQVREELDIDWSRRIVSVLYPDSEVKGELLGTRTSEVARPWKAEIHLSLDSWSESLKHELVHVLAREFGPNYIGVPFVRVLGLTEGLAMAIEWDYGDRSLHEYAAGMLRYGLMPPLRRLITTFGFAGGTSSVGYVAGGSFTRWLIDRHGLERMKKAYASDDITGVYGESYDRLERGWHEFLRSVPPGRADSLATAYLFRRPSLFTAVCPRTVGDRTKAAAALMRRGKWVAALRSYEALERLAPGAGSAFGVVQAQFNLGGHDSVIAVSTRLLGDTVRAFSVVPMLLWQGASFWSMDDSAQADASFSRLIDAGIPGWTGERARRYRRVLREYARDGEFREAMLANLHIVTNPDSLRSVLAEKLFNLARSKGAEGALLEEAVLRLGAEKQWRDTARQMLERISPERRSPLMWRVLGTLYYRRDLWARAEYCFSRARDDVPATARMLEDWRQRCVWKRKVSEETKHVK